MYSRNLHQRNASQILDAAGQRCQWLLATTPPAGQRPLALQALLVVVVVLPDALTALHVEARSHARQRRVRLFAIHLNARGGLLGALTVQVQLVQEHDEDERQRDGADGERPVHPDHHVASNGMTHVRR